MDTGSWCGEESDGSRRNRRGTRRAAGARLRALTLLQRGAVWLLLAACAAPARPPARLDPVADVLGVYRPAQELAELFHDVQVAGVFEDSKTFVDARPLDAPSVIVARYREERGREEFSLRAFVERHFELPPVPVTDVPGAAGRSMSQHIRQLWPLLTRAADRPDPRSSLIALPHPYVVPGGRFREVYYWDSYFTMLGLLQDGHADLVERMLDNFAHLARTVGHIPNANRSYYLSRSQPPYFAAMVGLYASATDSASALRWLDALEQEHRFWMDGAAQLRPGQAHRRVVRLASGAVLNRYWDDLPEPRPESYREDEALGRTLSPAERERFYRNVRAAAESGWDFSSRWMRNVDDLRSLETVELVPLDLNALLYHAERTIAALRRLRGAPGDRDEARRMEAVAAARRAALLAVAWDDDARSPYFYDVRWRTGEQVRDRPNMSAVTLLYFGLATPVQAAGVAARLEREFLRSGGFVTTLERSGQQWDAPNGWPPLQWLAIEGLRRYGHHELADRAATRWLELNERTYRATGRMMEKYDVIDPARPAGGGEYPTQDGFGWTNGVAQALRSRLRAPAGGRAPVDPPASAAPRRALSAP